MLTDCRRTLMSVWATKKKFRWTKASLQVGKGSKNNNTQAAHCSTFPQLQFEKTEGIWENFLCQSPSEIVSNSTMVLPTEVNRVDTRCDCKTGKFRDKAIVIVNKVAAGNTSILNGMKECLAELHNSVNSLSYDKKKPKHQK